jgi:2-iminobutanoate/2-iminopropanoate deaminase
MPERQFVDADNLLPTRQRFGYSQAVKVGNTVYLAGQNATDKQGAVCHKRNFAEQLEMTLENIKNVVTVAGGTMQDVVRMTLFCRNLFDLGGAMPLYQQYFGDHRPAMTAVEVVQLWNPHLLVEIEAVAVIGEPQTIIGA